MGRGRVKKRKGLLDFKTELQAKERDLNWDEALEEIGNPDPPSVSTTTYNFQQHFK